MVEGLIQVFDNFGVILRSTTQVNLFPMLKSYRFFQVDVFTDQPLCGNPLAVFPDAVGLDSGLMQKISAEMNLSETTFVFPATNKEADYDVRIFTPSKEIPFGGHPTLGTAEVLKQLSSSPTPSSYKLNMGVGIVPVYWEDDFCTMTQPEPQFTPPLPTDSSVAEALGLSPDDLHPFLPVQEVSTGFPALMIPLRAMAPVNEVQLNLAVLKKVLDPLDLAYVFCMETEDKACQVHARSFAPFIGIPEDPATGSVAGALGAYLLRHKVFGGDCLSICIEQGVKMGRRSEIRVETSYEGEIIKSVKVGGQSRIVIEGQLTL